MSRQVEIAQRLAALPAQQPLVSVVIPTHNRAHLLPRAVMSVLGQTWRNLELIVVDDGSSDATAEVLARIDDPRLRVVRRNQGTTAGAARNAGIAAARGDYIAFNDDDDIWLPHKLERQVGALIEAPRFGFCLCGRLLLAPGRSQLIAGAALAPQLDFTRGNGQGGPDYALIATPSWVVRRSAFEAAGTFDERLVTWEDWELALRLWLATNVLVVDEPLYIQDQLAGGNLFKLERAKADAMRIIEDKHGALWASDRSVRARHQYVIGLALNLYEPRPAGRAELWRALQLHPGSTRTLAALALAYLPQGLAQRLTQVLRDIRGSIHRKAAV